MEFHSGTKFRPGLNTGHLHFFFFFLFCHFHCACCLNWQNNCIFKFVYVRAIRVTTICIQAKADDTKVPLIKKGIPHTVA